MLEYAQRISPGLPASAVVLEEASTSTRTNALLSIPLMVERGCAQCLLSWRHRQQFVLMLCSF